MIGFLKTHPFWTLLIAFAVVSLLSFVLFGGTNATGHGTGGLEIGPITTEPGP